MRYTRILLTGFCVCGFAAASAAGAATLNVKPGLWEMTSSGETHGTPPIPAEVLAQMPPERRAKFQAAIAASMARAGKPHVYKSCVTEKSLQRGFDPNEHSSGEQCTPTVLSSSPSMMDVRVQCSGPREHTTGRFHFEAPNPATMNGTIDMTISEGAHSMRVKRVMHGQWISADCGKYARKGE